MPDPTPTPDPTSTPTKRKRGRPLGKAPRDPALIAHLARLRETRTLREIAAASGVRYERLRDLVLSRTVATEFERNALLSLA